MVAASVPTTVIMMSFLPVVVDGRAAAVMRTGPWSSPTAMGPVGYRDV